MVFSSLEFILYFLPAFLLVYHLLPQRLRNSWLLLCSLGFYAWGTREHPEYFLLLLLSVVINFGLGRALGRSRRKAVLAAGLLFNFGTLFLFKYSGFCAGAVNSLLGTSIRTPELVLPIGISFYTFQAASYLIDVYRGSISAERNSLYFATYITMFPKLISGPIVRYTSIRQQLHHRKASWAGFQTGLGQFISGLGMKVLLANRIGGLWRAVNGIGFESVSTPLAWMGIAACSLQLYFDFWGYSLMAMGLGSMMGFSMPENFRHPYQARSMTEFWRCWHITLGQWFKDYVYIPLGGSRCSKAKTYRNLLVVWLLTGIWHGAGWNFLLWGLFLFVVLAIEKAGLLHILEKKPLLSRVYMLLLIPLSWLLFSVTDLQGIGIYLMRLIGLGGNSVFLRDYLKYFSQYGVVLVTGILFCTPIPYRVWDRVKKPWATAVALLVIFLSCLYYLYQGLNDPFLYFNF